jgi:hypothetical protein
MLWSKTNAKVTEITVPVHKRRILGVEEIPFGCGYSKQRQLAALAFGIVYGCWHWILSSNGGFKKCEYEYLKDCSCVDRCVRLIRFRFVFVDEIDLPED